MKQKLQSHSSANTCYCSPTLTSHFFLTIDVGDILSRRAWVCQMRAVCVSVSMWYCCVLSITSSVQDINVAQTVT
jgi:hypothetical protein